MIRPGSKEWLESRSVETLNQLAKFYDLSTIQGILIQIELNRRRLVETNKYPVLV